MMIPEDEPVSVPETVEVLPLGEERYERFRRMVKEHRATAFAVDNADGCILMDVQTANLLVTVAEALNQKNRAHFLSMDLLVMVDIAWKLVK